MKRIRHKAILDLIKTGAIASQDDLMRGLEAKKIDVSQSTLSRDIQELRLAKAGGMYTLVEGEPPKTSDDSVRRIIQEFVEEIDMAQNIVVIKTGPGNASTVSQAIDDAGWPEAVGSIAGDNTIFIVVRSLQEGKRLVKRIGDLLA